LSASASPPRSAAPVIGAHSERVLAEIGVYAQSEIRALQAAGVIE
jgi:crotonobetainyl-CoA:carnitine CoA-transferase CaiB-like acyl-CoA transferase